MNEWDEMRTRVNAAKQTIRAAEDAAASIASMLEGRLRAMKISGATLKQFKRELRDFNIHTGAWKR